MGLTPYWEIDLFIIGLIGATISALLIGIYYTLVKPTIKGKDFA